VLEGLEAVDWAGLTHAYGPAADVPGLLRQLTSADAEARGAALFDLYGNIYHQGTVYEATAHAVPFLVELLRAPEIPDKEAILGLLQAIGQGSSYLQVHAPLLGRDLGDEEQARIGDELVWVARARQAVADGADAYLRLVSDRRPEVRVYAAYLLGSLRELATRAMPVLEGQLAGEADERARASLVLAIAALAPDASDGADRLRGALGPDEPAVVRLAAARALASWWSDAAAATSRVDSILVDALVDTAGRADEDADFPWSGPDLDVTSALLGLGSAAAERALDRLAPAVRDAAAPAARQLASHVVAIALHGVPGGHRAPEPGALGERQRRALRAVLENDAAWADGPLIAWAGGVGRRLGREELRRLL
jgi:hypothetical protein